MKKKNEKKLFAKEEKMRLKTENMTLADAIREEKENKIFSPIMVFGIINRFWKSFVCVVLVLTCGASFVCYNQSLQKASAVMSLNYEESSKGLNPNSSRFDLSKFRSEECMQLALESAGLQDVLTAAELADMVSIKPVSNGRITTDGNYYINSSYNVSVKMPYSLRNVITSEDLLGVICRSYQKWFRDNYVVTAKALKDTSLDLGEMDYTETESYFSMITERILRYLDVRQKNASTFISSDGSTFKSIRQLATNLESYELSTYSSYVWEKGLSKNPERQVSTLKYTNSQYMWDYKKSMGTSDALREIVEDYNNEMTSSVLIPTYDLSDQFYMARTKTGIDDITKEADQDLSTAVSTMKTISTNEDKIAKIEAGAEKDAYRRADKMIENIEEQLNSIIDQIIKVDNEYVQEKTGDYIFVKYNQSSLISKIHLKKILMADVLICAVMYLAIALYKKRSMKRTVAWMRARENRGEQENV